MKILNTKFLSVIVGLCAVLGAAPAMADDSEVFTSATVSSAKGVRPNVLFIIDTSGSMSGLVAVYDPDVTYSGDCTDYTRIYWRQKDSTKVPSCDSSTPYITTTANRCRAMYLGFSTDGWWRGKAQQLASSSTAWQDLDSAQPSRRVECALDMGKHGDDDASIDAVSANTFARNGSGSGRANRWGNESSTNQVLWDGSGGVGAKPAYSFYSANYINWYNSPTKTKYKSRLEIVRNVAEELIDKLQNVNLGLMRYSNNEGPTYETTAQGGMVTYPVSELTATTRTDMKKMLDDYKPDGNTPLSETLYEAQQYFAGRDVDFGNYSRINKSNEQLSVDGSRTAPGAKTYDSPMDFSCQTNYIVYLTDGLPTADNGADTQIKALPDFATDGAVPAAEGGGGSDCPALGPDGSTNGRCLVNLAKYMNTHDLRGSAVGGKQTIKTYVVGFGDDIETSADFLENVAKAGGGKAYTNKDQAGLSAALEEIFADVAVGANTTFVSPTVAVNAFNRTRNLNTLFISVFAPSNRLHWPGNLKKYQLVNGVIYGTDTTKGAEAVDPTTGFFSSGSKDMFSKDATADGPNVNKGGAASAIPGWAAGTRNVYTYLTTSTSKDLTDSSNAVTDANTTAITSVKIGLPVTATAAQRTQLIEFIRGRDWRNDDDDKPVVNTDDRHAMGDPMRVRPAVGIYGGTEAKPDGTVYITSNDGVLHAFNMDTGEERWSFIPEEFLARQQELYADAITPGRKYGLDSDVRLFRYDADGDGLIESGDKMYAIFGFGRGGSALYALDVTSQTTPRFLWKKTATELPKLGQTWSAPIITRVNVNSSKQTDPQKFVVIFGAGYDESQEAYNYTTDGKGNAIYMLEMATGNQLWLGSIDGTAGANWTNKRMNNSIPSDISVLDIDGDTYADRMYVGDMGGRVWRFDIWHGQIPDKLVTGGMFAALGAGEISSPTLADTRRFYYAPDLAVVAPRGSRPYLNVAIGSGYRGHPLETKNLDRFYSLRDYAPFTRLVDADYKTPITDGATIDITTKIDTKVPDGSTGWRLELANDGEKVLAESITAGGVIFFPTFTPRGSDTKNPCLPQTLNRTYAVYLDSAKPFGLRDGAKPGDPPETDSADDRYIELKQGGIAPGMALVKTPEGKTLCLEGVESLGRCVDIGDVVRTYWEHR